MSHTFDIIANIFTLVVGVAGIAFLLWMWLKKSRDPAMIILRWVLTAAMIAVMGHTLHGMMVPGQVSSAFGLLATGVFGIIMAIIWVPVIVEGVSRQFGNLYTGGDVEVEPKPMFSIFHAQRSKGKYWEALAEIRRQLDKFPNDFETQMLLAGLQAENLNDLPGAEITIQRICSQPGHTPINIAYALNQLADWHLQLVKDREAAQRALEKIEELLPNTELSLKAAQRISRLADTETLLAPFNRRRVTVTKGMDNIGLLRERGPVKPVETDGAALAAEYVKHLESHPLDSLTRERLAVLYARHYQRLDLATEQLEQLIQQPNQPAKQVVKWLNLLADLQVEHNAEPEVVRATLQRIIDQYPDVAAAENTRRRLEMLNLEIKAHKNKSQAVKLGTYEQDIGLKRQS